MLLVAQVTTVFAAANETNSSCFAQVVTGQGPGEIAESITSNLSEAHPIGFVVISFTAVMRPPCFGDE